MSESIPTPADRPQSARFTRPVIEWGIWIAISAWIYSQTGYFDTEIPEYAFGATGWPRTLCLAMALGATGQLIYQITEIRRGGSPTEPAITRVRQNLRQSLWSSAKRLPIFVFPLVYLYFVPTIGFYLATPFFIIGLLLILEVRSPIAILSVTSVVYGLVLLLFTRLFYVALPTGRVAPFYDINIAIIGIARSGM